MEKVIDAKNKTLGRVASEAASVLRGKDNPNFQPNIAPDIKLEIINISQIKISPKKLKEKEYVKYSGYQSGQKFEPMEKLIKKYGMEEVFRRAVKRMLPNNKLNRVMMKNLVFKK